MNLLWVGIEMQAMRIRSACPQDADELAPRLRKADLQEIQALTREPPPGVLARCIGASIPCYSVLDMHGQLSGVFGVVPEDAGSRTGQVWLVGSDALVNDSWSFLRLSRKWVSELQLQYSILWNRIDARNEVHIRWLRWCGFRITRRVEAFGIESRLFYEFVRIEH